MRIRSFLVHLRAGHRDRVAAMLRRESGCDVYPSENADLLVLVTDLPSREAEAQFDDRLTAHEGVVGVALVAGYHHAGPDLEP
jgi:nitrate reductase NapAB chaperone NapD